MADSTFLEDESFSAGTRMTDTCIQKEPGQDYE